jgi:cytochrome c553
MKKILILSSIVSVAAVVAWLPLAADAPKPQRDPTAYVGAKTCSICHDNADTGKQFSVWKEGPHAKAFESLASDQAKEVGAKLGIENPQTSPSCLKCHSTAYHWTEKIVTDKIKVQESVSCESCHGPGRKYMPKTVHGESREKGIAAGMIYPAMQSCEMCHNDSSPTWKADRYTKKDGSKVGFDPEQAWEKIKHPNPKSKR